MKDPGALDTFVMYVRVLDAISRRLKTISRLLRAIQGKTAGSIHLYLYECGKSCSGCPHPKWRKAVRNRATGVVSLIDIARPARVALRVPIPEKDRQVVISLVQEAQYLLDRRKNISRHVSNLRKALADLNIDSE